MSLYSWSVKLTTRQYFTINPKTIHYNKSLYYQNYFEPTNFANKLFLKWESISWRRHNLTPALKLLENFLLFVNKTRLSTAVFAKKKVSAGHMFWLAIAPWCTYYTTLLRANFSRYNNLCSLNSPRNWRGRRFWLKSTINSNKNSLEVLSWYYICFSTFYKEKKIENFAEFDFGRVWKCVN